MHALWVWLMVAAGEVAIAMRLAVGSQVVQRVLLNMQWYTNRILIRARDIWLMTVEEAEASGMTIVTRMPIAEQAVREYWDDIERVLIRAGVTEPAISELKAGLIRQVYEKWLMQFTVVMERTPRGSLPFL